jgi:hypothetical protein
MESVAEWVLCILAEVHDARQGGYRVVAAVPGAPLPLRHAAFGAQ